MKKPAHRFAVATADPDFQAAFKQAVGRHEKRSTIVLNRADGAGFLSSPDLVEDLQRSEANILVVDIGGGDKDEVISRLRDLAGDLPDIRVMLVGQPATAAELLDLMRAGVSDYLPKPLADEALEGALDRITRGIVAAQAKAGKSGRVIGFLGPKGGTGVTTTVTNAAIKLKNLTGKEVLLADLNAELGTAAILLGVRPRYNFVELVKNLHRMDEDLLRSYVTRHESGVAFLPSPLTARDLEGVTKQRINATMALLRSQFEHVLLDLGNSMTPLAQAGLGVCDEVVVVLTPEVPALRNAKRLLPLVAQAVSGGQSALRFVVNRYDSKIDIPLTQIRETLGHDIALTFPRVDEASTQAANVGRPMAMDGSGKYEKALNRLGMDVAAPGSLNGVANKRNSGRGLLSRFRPGGRKDEKSDKPATVDLSKPSTAEN